MLHRTLTDLDISPEISHIRVGSHAPTRASAELGLSGVLIKPENVASWKCVLDPKRLVCPPRYALCGKRLNPATMVLAIMSLINADFVDSVDLFRHLIPRSGVKFPCRK